MFAHSANLPVQPLNQNDSENLRTFLNYFAFFGGNTKHRHTIRHALYRSICKRFINGNYIFFFVVISCTQNPVHHIAVVSQENQALRIFIQSANRKNPNAIIYIIYNVVAYVSFCSRNNTNRFVECNKNNIFCNTWF